jgi:HEAT repeat protein
MMRVEALENWIERMLDQDMDDERREKAAIQVGGFGEAALPELKSLIDAPDIETRWWAARALAAVGGPDSVALLLAFLTDPNADVRACAALGLGTLKATQAISDLISALDDPSAYVARIASNALISVGAPAAPELIVALSHPSPAVRIGAARALVPLESHAAIPALFTALDDDHPLVAYYSQEALWRMGVGMVLFKP